MYILASYGIFIGKYIFIGFSVQIIRGNSLPLWNIPLGTSVHNVEFYLGRNEKLSRSAGIFTQLLNRIHGLVTLRFPSNKIRALSQICWATVGQVSNLIKKNIKLGKSGCICWFGRRPEVRGRAINSVEHAHGGGEG